MEDKALSQFADFNSQGMEDNLQTEKEKEQMEEMMKEKQEHDLEEKELKNGKDETSDNEKRRQQIPEVNKGNGLDEVASPKDADYLNWSLGNFIGVAPGTMWQMVVPLHDLYERHYQSCGPYPERPGEKDCQYYMRTGVCSYGPACRFNHPVNINQSVVCNGEFPERIGQPECQYYLRTGTCKYGTTCKYHHPPNKERSNQKLNSLGFPLRQGEKKCPFYMRTGSCKYGVTCKFHHPELAAVRSPPGTASTIQGGGQYVPFIISTPPNMFLLQPDWRNYMQGCGSPLSQQKPKSDNVTKDSSKQNNNYPPSVDVPDKSNEQTLVSQGQELESKPSEESRGSPPEMLELSHSEEEEKSKNLITDSSEQKSDSSPSDGVTESEEEASLSQMQQELQSQTYVKPSKSFNERSNLPNLKQKQKSMNVTVDSSERRSYSSLTLRIPAKLKEQTMPQGQRELQSQPNVKPTESLPERHGLSDCEYYIKTGICIFGSTCKNFHPKERTIDCPLSPIGLPLRPVSTYKISFLYSNTFKLLAFLCAYN
eukprot:TRINITY_DN11628_c0_g1_i3.p1 TRINITY_DN11628_c0_g1~~TRINITY_DN11628_c0_g1_i3.p1  ORF type:complete len:539 (+),score=104.04 TRINITY_DN11628_c0_g1_i3:192-1808(+)